MTDPVPDPATDNPADPLTDPGQEPNGPASPVQPGPRLPIRRLAHMAAADVLGRPGLIFRFGALWFVTDLMLSPAFALLFDSNPLSWAEMVSNLLEMLVFAPAVAVAWTRAILLGEDSPATGAPWLRFEKRELRYMIRQVLLLPLPMAVVWQLTSLASGILPPALGRLGDQLVLAGGFALVVACLVVALSCTLILPAVACDRPLRPSASWRLMKGNRLRLMAANLLLVGGPSLLMLLAGLLAADPTIGDVRLMMTGIAILLLITTYSLASALTARAFAWLSHDRQTRGTRLDYSV